MSPPDRDGRAAILAVHMRGVPLADDVDLEQIAQSTPGMVGADLTNLVNEAALIAARRDHDRVQRQRLHRRARADRARRRAPHHALARRARAHGLPRERPRAARDAAAGRRPGAQGLDRPPRARPRRDLPGARRRPLRLRRRLPARPHHRRPRRPRGRGARLRRRHHRRRVRPRAGHAHRPADGRPLGHVGGDRPGLGAARAQRRAAALPGIRRPDVAAHPRARRRGGAPDRRRVLREALGMLRENRDG